MRKHKALLISFLFCLAGWTAYGQGPSWKVEIKLAQTEVKNKQDFIVATAVRNISREEQTLYVWPCTYPLWWSTDNPVVQPNGVACLQNSLATVRLKPGKAWEEGLPFHIALGSGGAGSESVTFRLGFDLANSLRESGPWTEVTPVWSNPVTIVVTR